LKRREEHTPSRKEAVEHGHYIWNARKQLCRLASYDPPERDPIDKLSINTH
jgi:hypothetical protein